MANKTRVGKSRKKMNTAKRRKKWSPFRLSTFSTTKKAFIFAIAFGLVGAIFLLVSHASNSPYDDARQETLKEDPARGITYRGLRLVKSSADHPCHGIFEIVGAKTNDNQPVCTHGGDPGPPGVDIRNVRAEQKLAVLKKVPIRWTNSSQIKAAGSAEVIVNDYKTGSFTNTYPLSSVPCNSGKYRIRLVLVSNVPANSYTTIASNLLSQTAHRMETQLEVSSIYSGAGAFNRHFRFVTNSSCQPTVAKLLLSTTTDLSTYEAVRTVLINHGFNNAYTKYLVWDYTNNSNFINGYCSQANTVLDSSPGLNNASNRYTGFGIITPGCWSSTAEMHELMHTLGAVQLDAPHTTGGTHCLDEHDEMCYPDHLPLHVNCISSSGISYPCGVNRKRVYVDSHCSDIGFQWLLDCNHDDYFSTAGDAFVDPGNYLYFHYNVATSPYLQ